MTELPNREARLSAIKSLLNLLKDTDLPPYQGISDEQLAFFTEKTGIDVPESLIAWLKKENGANAPPGNFFGIGVSPEYLDVLDYLTLYPEWAERKWIPVASDGCGNYFVVDTQCEFGPNSPILFLEMIDATDKPCYIVASDYLVFMHLFLEKERRMALAQEDTLEPVGWPFDEEEAKRLDPGLLECHGAPMPWDAL